jgi:radical SAM-linked protein
MAPQRVRIVFRKGAEIKYISHLDLMRAWERALRRADIPLAYSQGFNPRPRLSFASALAVGFTGRAEMLDVFLEQHLGLREVASRLEAQLPAGLQLESAAEIPIALPSLPSQVIASEYEVRAQGEDGSGEIDERLRSLLAAESIPRRRELPDRVRTYDLRPLIEDLRLVGRGDDMVVIAMQLLDGPRGTGRPDEVMDALGMAERVGGVERVRIILRAP